MKVYLLRHGRTAYNDEARYQGWRDVPLSAGGEAQLARAGISPETVWVSPLIRARRTAEILFPSARQIILEDLKEMNFGAFEGRTWQEMADDADYRNWVDGGCEGRCPGGESKKEFCDRVCGAFADALERAEDAGEREAVIVAHGGVQMAVLERFALPRRGYYDWHAPCGGGYLLETDRSRRRRQGWLRLIKQAGCGEGGGEW